MESGLSEPEFTALPLSKRLEEGGDGECQVLIDETQGLAGMLGILTYHQVKTLSKSQKYTGRPQRPGVGGWGLVFNGDRVAL